MDMGNMTFTPTQRTIVSAVAKSNLAKQFYFTGGTALAACYLHHRESEDLDFFSETDFENQEVIDFMHDLAGTLELEVVFTQRYKARIFELKKNDTFVMIHNQ